MVRADPRQPAAPPGNVLTPERVQLGAMLLFDPRMSRSGVFSCQSCHNVGLGGVDGLQISIGHGWQMGLRNSPTILNAIFNIAQFGDGRAPDLAAQAKDLGQARVEMNNTPENLIGTLNSMPGYVDAFTTAFPEEAVPVSFDNFARAIEAFEATLITPDSAFHRYLKGDDAAMTHQEKRGLAAFMATGCTAAMRGGTWSGRTTTPLA
jgi:cytochrome c peroxidase